MTRKSSIIFGIFVAVVVANLLLDRVLTGGGDAQIISGALAQLREARGFIGTISATMPSDRSLTETGDLAILSGSGRFFIPQGKTLVGTWNISEGSTESTSSLLDAVVIGDGRMYIRDHGLSGIGLSQLLGTVEDQWVELPTSSLWPATVADGAVSGSKLWNEIFDLATSADNLGVLGRAMSENVAGVPSWHFVMTVTPQGTYKIGKAFAELKSGHKLLPHEDDRLQLMAAVADPKIDLWVNKKTGQIRQVALTYLVPSGEGVNEDDLEPVIVTFSVLEYPAWEPVVPPAEFMSQPNGDAE
jgi:hypothetical protein